MNELTDEVVIITGSTKGIGKRLALTLASQGAAVIVNGRNARQVEEVVVEIETLGGRAVGVPGSVEDPLIGEQLVSTAVNQFGKVTTLINNAGIVRDRMSYKMTVEQFHEVIDVHVKGSFHCTSPFVQWLKQNETCGMIINMTSSAGLMGNIGQINYSAAKAAIVGMTYTLATELKRDHIQVNAIAPAALTDMTRPHIDEAKKKAEAKGETLPAYWEVGSTDDVAHFVTELIRHPDLNRTGEVYSINGETQGLWHKPVHEVYSSK